MSAETSREKPNLLFIYTDEQAYNTLAAYGNNRIEMPNLNKLADDSTVYRKAYVTQPVCTPSRSTLLTGQWPHTNGCFANNIPISEDTLCLPEMVSDPEYVTAHMGKWHLGDEIYRQHGFDEWCSIDDGYRRYYSNKRSEDDRSDYHRFLVENGFSPDEGGVFPRGTTARYGEEYSKPAFLAREAEKFISSHRDQPFILYINFFEPHMPYFGPRDNQYPLDEIPLPNIFASPAVEQPLKTQVFAEAYYQWGHSGLVLRTDDQWKRLIANYWGLCSLVDTYAGKILDVLRRLNLYDDTIIVFTSDHGDMMGAHRLTAKCTMYEEAVRVPLLIKRLRQSVQEFKNEPVSHIDIVPTLLDLLGVPRHSQCQGKPLQARVPEDVFIEWQGPNSGIVGEGGKEGPSIPPRIATTVDPDDLARHILDPVRSIVTQDGWKMNYSTLGEHELYNLDNDPGEATNLANHPDYRGLIDELHDRIGVWQLKTSDPLLENPNFGDPDHT